MHNITDEQRNLDVLWYWNWKNPRFYYSKYVANQHKKCRCS